MRFLTWTLACILCGALTAVQADEPSKAPAPSSVATPASNNTVPVSSTAPAVASPPAAKPDMNDEMLEKHFRSEGYKVQLRNGKKWYCTPMIETGTRLASPHPVCAPGQLLLMNERQQQEDLERAQRIMGNAAGK
ncbi:MAG TPA: hypothetical protein VLV29_09130 [Steroidobacteraceae bacterium]|nr:hypothetical protein [Steroidobacteraceae bacterium]